MKIKYALIAAALFAAQAANAGDIYVGAGVGQSRLHADYGHLDTDTKDVAGKILVGKQLNKNFGVEASYFDLGDFSASFAGQKVGAASARGLGLDLVATLPVTERFAVLGRAGVTRTRVDTEWFGDRDHQNKTQPKLGLGVQYALTKNLALRGEYEAYRTSVSYNGQKEKSHVGVLGATLVYTFGAKPSAPAVVKTAYVAPVAEAPVYVAPVAPAYVAPVVEAPVVTTKKVRE